MDNIDPDRRLRGGEDTARDAVLHHFDYASRYRVAAEHIPLLDRFRSLHRELQEAGRVPIPDAPFKDTWHTLALKRLISHAVETGHTAIAWTSAQQQKDRWRGTGGEMFDLLYDKKIPQALNKIGKKFGAKVGTGGIVTLSRKDLTERMSFGPAMTQQDTLPITPEMSEHVREHGLPLFAAKRLTPEQRERRAAAARKRLDEEERVRRTGVAIDPSHREAAARVVKEERKKAVAEAVAESKQRAEENLRNRINEVRLDAADKERTMEARRKTLEELINDLPKEIQADLPPTVLRLRVRSDKGLQNAIASIEKAVARHERAEAHKRLRKVLKKLRPEKLGESFRGQVEKIFGSIDPSKMRKRTEERLLKTAEFLSRIDEGENEELKMMVPRHVREAVSRLSKTAVADMTTEEAHAAADAITLLMQMNRLKNNLIRQRKSVAATRIKATVLKEMREARRTYMRELKPGRRADFVETEREGWLKRARKSIGLSRAQQFQPDAMATLLGGSNSETWRVLYDDLRRSHDEMVKSWYEATDYIQGVLLEHGVDTTTQAGRRAISEMSEIIAGERGRIWAVNAEGRLDRPQRVRAKYIKFTIPSTGDVIELTEAELIDLLAHFKDPTTVENLLRGAPIVLEGSIEAKESEKTLTAGDIVHIQRFARDNHGRAVALSDAMVAYANGPMAQLMKEWSVDHLGYSIVNNETWWSRRRRRVTAADDQTIKDANLATAGITSSQFVKPRRDARSPIIVTDALAKFSNMAWTIGGIRHMDPAIRAAKSVLRDEGVNGFITTSKHGRDVLK
jgi:hypothetical protein